MKTIKVNDGYVLRLDKDEEVISSVADFAAKNSITFGFIHGLGGVQKATIGYYELEEKKYHFKEFKNLKEIISLNGNIALKDEMPFLHLHGAFSGSDLKVIGGHVKEAVVAGTCELYLSVFNEPIKRKKDTATGLDLMDL